MDLIADTKAWVTAPFTQRMDLLHVFLLTGLVVVSLYLWHRIISRLAAEV